MRKSLLCLLSAFLVLSSMTARNFNGTDLISIDFWVNGATDIEESTISTIENGLDKGLFEKEDLAVAKLFRETGIVVQQKYTDGTVSNLSELILTLREIYGESSIYEGMALAAIGRCNIKEPAEGIRECQEGIMAIESSYGPGCKEWILGMTFLGTLNLLSENIEEAEADFSTVTLNAREYAPYQCMPSIIHLSQSAVTFAENGNEKYAMICIGPAVELLGIFFSSRADMESEYADLPARYKPACDYEMLGMLYINLSYAYSKLGKYDESAAAAETGMSALQTVGLEDSRIYAMLKHNMEDARKVQDRHK